MRGVFGGITVRRGKRGVSFEARFRLPDRSCWREPDCAYGVPSSGRVGKRFKTRSEAEEWLERQKRLAGLRVWMPEGAEKAEQKARNILFRDYALEYVEGRRKGDGSPISVTTRQKYEQYLRCWLLPAFGGLRLRDVTFQRVRRFYDSFPVDASGRGVRNRQAVMALLNGILNAACRMQPDGSPALMERNPCEAVRVAQNKPKRRDADVTMGELKSCAAAMPEQYAPLLFLIGVAGLRPGEALALTAGDLRHETGVWRSAWTRQPRTCGTPSLLFFCPHAS